MRRFFWQDFNVFVADGRDTNIFGFNWILVGCNPYQALRNWLYDGEK
jgi:hypothetical protein